MRGITKIIGAVAVAGTVAAGSAAFTGSGVSTDDTAEFVGGTVHQTVTGAALSDVHYVVDSGSPGWFRTIELHLNEEAVGRTVTVGLGGGLYHNDVGNTTNTDVAFTCTTPDATFFVSTCTIHLTADPYSLVSSVYYTDLDDLSVTVVSAQL